ncbi:nSTAND1 domain-containing NTPase [Nonomuraea sp. ZG12]|uniref:nSTAND1 domain-containing NTPase n=1 Tax=Nonomuraea sp. ZG12 TaxID=3452207 RepID=UPI003F8B6294
MADTAARVTEDDLLAIRAYPAPLRKNILSHVGLRDMRSITKLVGVSLARTLHGNDRRRRSSLIRNLSRPFISGFENHDELSQGECVDLLRPVSAAAPLSKAHALVEMLANTRALGASVTDLVLAEIYRLDVALSPIALAFLTHSSQRMAPAAAGAVGSAWTELRALYPVLPEQPISFHQLRDVALSLPSPSAPIAEVAPVEDEGSAQERSEMTPHEPSQVSAPSSTDALRAELDLLREMFLMAADAAERARVAFADGARPSDQDADVIARGVQDFDGLRDMLESAQGAPIAALTNDALAEALNALESTGATRHAILALAQVSGPPQLEGLLQEVREATAVELPALEILAELIRLADDDEAIMQVVALQERFREEAPGHWVPLATAASRGMLVIPSVPVIADRDVASPSDEGAGGVSGTADEPQEPSAPTALEAEPTGENELADLDAFIAGNRAQLEVSKPARPSKTRAAVSRKQEQPPASALPAEPERPSAEPPQTSSPAPAASSPSIAGDVAEAEALMLRSRRFGLAAWLRDAAGRPSAEANARRCAAIAADMSEFAGRLSAAFTECARGVSMKALGDDTPGQLLAWAAALRTGLIHPTAEAADLLDEHSSILSPYPGLAAYGEAFSEMARAGAYLVPGLSGRMHNASQAEADRNRAAAAAARFLEDGPSQKIKFALATEVWKFLLLDDKSVGRLLSIAAQDDAFRVREVTQELDALRAGGAIDRMIDESTKTRSSRKGGNHIHSSARAKLVEKIDRALDLVADWVTAVREVESLRTDDTGVSWVVKPLDKLRTIVNRNRPMAQEELASLAGSADPLIAAAAVGASLLVGDTLRLLDGGTLEQPEPSAAQVLHADLLLSPAIRFDGDSVSPLDEPELADLLTACAAGDRDWRAAFEARAARGDHAGTRALLSVLGYEDPALATELRGRREKLVDAARRDRDDRIEDIQDRIAEWRRDGVLPETIATRFVAMLQALGNDDRDDFDAVSEALSVVAQEAAGIRQEQMATELAALDSLSAENTDVATVRERIRAYIESGDLTTAREFTAQAKAGNQLPEISDAVDHLEQYFPHFPQAFEAMSARLPGRQKAREGAEWLQKLKDALHSGNEIGDSALSNLLLHSGLSISAIPRGRRGVSENGLRFWQHMAQGPKSVGNFRSTVTGVLQMIGLEGDQEASREEQNRIWITLNRVRTIGDPLLPSFGSRMSPSADRLRLLLVWKSPGPQQVIEWLKDQPEDQTVLVFYFGILTTEQRRQLAAASRRRPAPVAAVLDDTAISYLACLPEANWSSTVSLLAPFTSTNPYAPTGDVPEEMFYGRLDQLHEVTSRTGSSFVYGGRQLGKSALLRKAERNVRKTDENRKVISEIIQNIGRITPVKALWPMLTGKLAEAQVLPGTADNLTDPKDICDEVKEWIGADPARQLLILLDEADEFLNTDARDAAFSNVIALRNLMSDTDYRVKVVFAGLHQTARFKSHSNQPITHLGTPIAVGPLEPQDAYSLLTKPLQALGFRFAPRLAARVIAEANNAPALIQLFADALLTRLRRTSSTHAAVPYEITREDVDKVWRDSKLARGFRDRFEWTLNLDKRYKVIAYTVAFRALNEGTDVTLTAGELRSECQEWWPQGFRDSTNDGFRGLLEECVNLGVLAADGESYRLRTPHILNLLGGADEVEAVLEQAETFERPDSFDAQSYRDAYKDNGECSPLTGSQVTRLLSPRNVLHLIAGSPALQIDRVATALEEAASRHKQAQTWRVEPGGLTFKGALQRAAQGSDHDVVIVDLTGEPHKKATTMYRAAADALSTPAQGTISIALIAPPEHASMWLSTSRGASTGDNEATALTGAAELIELQRFNRPAIRQWMYEVGLGFQEDPSRAALLRTTGGWPLLISKVINTLADGDTDREHALEFCQAYLEREPKRFVQSTGVLSSMAISSAWRMLVEVSDIADTPETLAGFLASGDDGHPLAEAGLQEEGYISTADLVEVLRILGALVPQDDGMLKLEPVLARATQRMGLPK